MDRSKKIGVTGGIIGGVVGSTLWMGILGIAVKSITLILIPILFDFVCIAGALRLFNLSPEKRSSISGLVVLLIVILNAIMVNVIYNIIPEKLCNLTTGSCTITLFQVNFYLFVFAIFGSFLIVKDIIRKE